jgi:hypothetical protein
MEFKDFVAFYGAIISSVVGAWNIYQSVNDRGKLKVHCYLADIVGDGRIMESNVLTYHVTNVGKKPVFVTEIGGSYKKSAGGKHFLLKTRRQTPIKLEPGEIFTEYTNDLSVLSKDVMALVAIDSLSRTYKVKRKILKQLIKQKDGGL